MFLEQTRCYRLVDESGGLANEVTTDAITPIPRVLDTDPESIKQSLLTGFSPEVDPALRKGEFNVLWAGNSFGIGSSRENSAEAVARCGIRAVVAESFGPIFRRNLIDWGVVPLSDKSLAETICQGTPLTFEQIVGHLFPLERKILFYGGLPGYFLAMRQGMESLPQQDILLRGEVPQTAVEKVMTVWAHSLLQHHGHEEELGRLQSGDAVVIRPEVFVGYDVFWAHVQRVLATHFGGEISVDPENIWLSTDHFRGSGDPRAQAAVKLVEEFWAANPTSLVGNDGVYNQVVPRRLRPGSVVAAMDSHSPELGVVPGVLVIPEGYTAFACALACEGLTLYTIPESISLQLVGDIPPYCDVKDVIWNLVGSHFVGSLGNGVIFEIGGSGYQHLTYSEAAKVLNATTEWGGIGAIATEPNRQVVSYLRRHGTGLNGVTDDQLGKIFADLEPDQDAFYRRRVVFDMAQTVPVMVGPHTHKRVVPLYQISQPVAFDRVIYHSCGGSSLLDLAVLAEVATENSLQIPVDVQIADPLTRYYAQNFGIIDRLYESGVRIANDHTCGPCLGSGAAVRAGERVLSTNNRNYPGRMGDSSAEVYLASGVVAAVAAAFGRAPLLEEVVNFSAVISRAKEKVQQEFSKSGD